MIQGTTYLLPDEPAVSLQEVNLVAPKNDGTDDTDWYRFQIIHVIRDDNVAEYRERLGPAKDFKADQLCVIGGIAYKDRIYIEETVATLKEHANDMRENPGLPFTKEELVNYQLQGLV